MKTINIPGYQLQHELGSGGMATVYLAVQESLHRRVALKVMSPALAADQSYTIRFLREARTIAQLAHPNIVAIHNFGVEGHWHYLALEYIPGGDLKQRIRQGMSPGQALNVVRQIAGALEHAHQKGVVHRDVKPGNILFREIGSAVLTDFGIARTINGKTRLTGTRMSIGTPQYMSPEQFLGNDADGRSDLYGLGIVLYEMLTGEVPYDAPETVAIGIKHITEPVPELPRGLSEFQPLIDSLLAKKPEERVQDCRDLFLAIETLRTSSCFMANAEAKTRDAKDDGGLSKPDLKKSPESRTDHERYDALSSYALALICQGLNRDVVKKKLHDEGVATSSTDKLVQLVVDSSKKKARGELMLGALLCLGGLGLSQATPLFDGVWALVLMMIVFGTINLFRSIKLYFAVARL